VVVEKKKVVVVKPQPKSDSEQVESESVVETPKVDESPSLMKNKAPSNASVVCAESASCFRQAFRFPSA
jgi:hypothetical protein